VWRKVKMVRRAEGCKGGKDRVGYGRELEGDGVVKRNGKWK